MKFYKVYISLPDHHYKYIVLVVSHTNDVEEQIKNWQMKNGLETETVNIDFCYEITEEVPFALEFHGNVIE